MAILFEEGLDFRSDRLNQAVEEDFSNATDVADYLVARGVPFREAYQLVGAVVRRCLEQHCLLRDLKLSEWKELHPAFEDDLHSVLAPEAVVAARTSEGGTGFVRVDEQLALWMTRINGCQPEG